MHLFFSVPPSTQRGGSARSAWRVVEGLRERGHRVRTVSAEPNDFVGDEVRDGDHLVVGEPPDVQSHTHRILRELRTEAPDVVVGWYATGPAIPAVMAARQADVPTVVTVRGNDLDRDVFESRKLPLLRLILERADDRFCVSQQHVDRLHAWFDLPGTVVHNGVDTSVFTPSDLDESEVRDKLSPDGLPIVLMAGAFKPKRGLAWLQQVAPESYQLVLVGDIQSTVEPIVPSTAVRLPWTDDPAALLQLYRAAHCVLQPSIDDGMPNVMLEAMACGTPVIGTPVGGMTDILVHGDNGFLFEDADGLRSALAQCADPNVCRRARETVPTLNSECAAWEEALTRVIERG